LIALLKSGIRRSCLCVSAFFIKIVKGPAPVHFVEKSVICHKIVEKNDILQMYLAFHDILKPETVEYKF
jgi:hypothetical protein